MKFDRNIRSNPPQNMTLGEVAEYIGVSRQYVRDVILKKDNIPHAKVAGKYIFRLLDVDKWLELRVQERTIENSKTPVACTTSNDTTKHIAELLVDSRDLVACCFDSGTDIELEGGHADED